MAGITGKIGGYMDKHQAASHRPKDLADFGERFSLHHVFDSFLQ